MPGDVVVHRQRLAQHEQVLFAPIAGQRFGDLFGAGLDTAITVPCQCLGIAFASNDVADDRLPGHPHHVGENLGELDVHLHESLLHALHPTGLFSQQHLSLTGHSAHHADVAVRTPSRAQEPQAHQFLQPLAVLDVALAPGNVLHLPRVNQPDLQAALLLSLIHI